MPLRTCTTPGCPNLTAQGRCPTHHHDTHRPSARSPTGRGYTARWQRTRQRHLRTHPTCTVCGAPATDVDHIDGQGPLGPQGHNPTNLRSFCHPCHSRRTARDQPGGWARQETTP